MIPNKAKFITTIILSLFISAYLNADQEQPNYQSIFDKANSLYKEGQYESAMEYYKKIQAESASVNYNLGNCAYKLNKLGLAHLYWRRAEKYWGMSDRTELLNNIKMIKEKIKEQKNGRKDKTTETEFKKLKNLKIQITSFIRATPLLFFQFVFLIFWIFLFVFIRKLFRLRKRLLAAMLFTFIAVSGLMLVSKYNFEYKQFGIVTDASAKLLSGPGDNYQVLSFVTEAKEVVIQKASNGFYKIKINGQIGWISQTAVEVI
jgi:tetratricopeptide (TPR) repeat protein